VSPGFFFEAIPTDSDQSEFERKLIRDFRSLRSDQLRQAASEMLGLFARAVATNRQS